MSIKNTPWLKAGLIGGVVNFVLTVLSNIPCIGCLFSLLQCFAWFVIPFAVGYYSVKWAKVKRDDYGEAAKTAALGGFVLGLTNIISTLVGVLMGIVLNFSMSNFMLFSGENTDYLTNSMSIPFMASFGVLVVLCFSIFGIIFDVILALVGGIINVALKKK